MHNNHDNKNNLSQYQVLPSYYPFKNIESNELTSNNFNLIKSDNNTPCPIHKSLLIPPSRFDNGCICGHNIIFRDILLNYNAKKQNRISGLNIKPKTKPITLKLK